jgi:hypothetical protein
MTRQDIIEEIKQRLRIRQQTADQLGKSKSYHQAMKLEAKAEELENLLQVIMEN